MVIWILIKAMQTCHDTSLQTLNSLKVSLPSSIVSVHDSRISLHGSIFSLHGSIVSLHNSRVSLGSVVDPHHADADPDPYFHFDLDPDMTSNFYADWVGAEGGDI
jgi:hypothetical protein